MSRPARRPPRVRPADPGDDTTLARVLARAFVDDPIQEWLLPRPDDREDRLVRMFRYNLRAQRARGQVWTVHTQSAAALWAAPGRHRPGAGEIITSLPLLASVVRGGSGRGLRALQTLERLHPHEPHWYLAQLGTDPSHQGRGLGSAVLEPVLERCDTEGLPAYLESSKEVNLGFYGRHGFEVRDEVPVAPGGPPLWTMWRDPR